MKLQARHYETGQSLEITIEQDRITEIHSIEHSEDHPWIAPGLVDVQINGYGGQWFSSEDLTLEKVNKILKAHYQFGITRLCPTLITNSFEAIHKGFTVLRNACESDPETDHLVAGCHLEGPYLSAEDGPRGAHPKEHIKRCDWDEFQAWQEASGNRIRLVTLAPEAGNAVDFIQRATANGVRIALGHTNATTEQIQAAVDAGATLSTHLGNGAHAMLARHPNYIWDQLGESRLMASLITDGFHLPASVVRSIFYAKGADKLLITCDASGHAGCSPGEYQYGGSRFEVLDDGRIVVAGQRKYLAGSGVQTDVCIAGMMNMTGCALSTAWNMASRQPSRFLGVEENPVMAGAKADLVLFHLKTDPISIQVMKTISCGKQVFTSTC